jgi:D-alanine-D-alanine ligase-like ATP-grasp enzyme
MKINYQKSKFPMIGGELTEARYKGVFMTLAEGADWVSIYSVDSMNQGKGEVQEMIDLIKKDYVGKKVYGSVPMNKVMKHIFDKKEVAYAEESI